MKNSKGSVWYGMHFYPGVAQYEEPGKDPYRVFLNEDTIRSMDPSFAGRPVFVHHVDGVDESIDQLRKEADGWVLESFLNKSDGKHWCRFIAVTEKAERAIKQGWQLSNSYFPKTFAQGGLWNGVPYIKEITGGEYEHLAIVPNPRYEESVIMSPEQFKKYNEDKELELKRLANTKEPTMAFNLFKRAKVDNSADLLGMMVTLPKSKKEVLVEDLFKEADDRLSNSPMAAHPEHLVDMGEGHKMTVNDLMSKYKMQCNEMEEMRKNAEEKEVGVEEDDGKVEGEGDNKSKDNEDDEDMDNEDEEVDSKLKMEKEEKTKNAKEAAIKKAKAKERADALFNAKEKALKNAPPVELFQDQVERGRARYGS